MKSENESTLFKKRNLNNRKKGKGEAKYST